MGLAKHKLVLSVPLYGQTFTLRNASENGLRDLTAGPGTEAEFTKSPGFMSYYEVMSLVAYYYYSWLNVKWLTQYLCHFPTEMAEVFFQP